MCTMVKHFCTVVLYHIFYVARRMSAVSGWPCNCKIHRVICYFHPLGISTYETHHHLRTKYRENNVHKVCTIYEGCFKKSETKFAIACGCTVNENKRRVQFQQFLQQ